ncbi:disease resistance protein Pik-2-like [Phragmites australis]|uniref:disease resistance protein Pik-2-like n=1 Tax=Phragmites australis TaxID=29695 RepID=UPI002D7918EC|nr:disease resistance protein Pik-2-like [Phragmites australis]
MAELAIGISMTAVQALMNKVETAIKEEVELWQIVQRDTVFMKDEFEMMQSFLAAADWGRIKNNVVRTWVRQVRDLSYDAEDCIESILLLDTKSSPCTWWFRLLPSCNSGALSPLDQAVAEIKLLKARVEEVSSRNMRYSLINNSGSKPVTPQQLASVSGAMGTTAVDILKEAWSNAKELGGSVDLTMLVTENNDALRVISLWGPGADLGMVSIIKEAYEKPEICRKFQGRAWLKLIHPFNPKDFIRSLVHQFYGNSSKERGLWKLVVDVLTGMEAAQGTNLVEDFVQQLNKHRYLVVLEDLSSMAEWHAVRMFLPDGKNGSRIVVSTQQLEIARLCAQPYQVLELRKLPDNQSICVFFNKDFKRVKEGMVDGGSSFSGTANGARLVGRSSDEDKLWNLISAAGHSNRAHVISVRGFPGVGKSDLVRTVWQRQASSQSQTPRLFEWYGWVDVSYPFNLRDFCARILSYTLNQSVGEYAGRVPQSEPDKKIIQECEEYLRDNRCLVVVDGLQSKEEWDSIKKLIHESSKSCIVVVTAEQSVAKHCAVQDDAVYGVKALGSKAALQLFRQKLQETRTSWDAHMLKEAKYILAKCGGIPEVIVALAKYLDTQQEDIRQRKLSRLKANFMHELETNPEFVSLWNLLAWMHLSVDALPQSLKACILYLSVFPQAGSIRRNRFVWRWIAEGYSKCTDSKTAEDYAGELFRLATRTTAIAEWQVNSFFHEYINSRLMEESVVFFPLIVSVLSEENCSLTTERLGKHLTIRSNWKRDEAVFDDLDFSQLQSLTVFGEWRTFFIPYKMRSLRVLDLEGTEGVTDEELHRILERLPRLRFLSLRGHREITCLPDSLYDLRLLQTLDIRDTSVGRLPSSIVKLQKLQYIRAGTAVPWMVNEKELSEPPRCSPLASVFWLSKFFVGDADRVAVEVPSKIGELTALHTLGAVKVNTASGAAILMELKKLITRLRKLELYGISRKNSQKLISVFNSGTHLESLTLCLEQDNHIVPWDDIRCMCNLRSLKLYGGHVKQLPPEIMYLHDIKKLSFQMISLTEHDIQGLGRLKNLHTLRLRAKTVQTYQLQFSVKPDDADSDRYTPDQFLQLKVLEIACSSRLHIKFGEGAVGKLEQVKLYCCNGSSLQLSGFEHPISLEKVWLGGSCDDSLKEALQQQLSEHPKKPTLRLN